MRLVIVPLILLLISSSMAQLGIRSERMEIALDGGHEVMMPRASLAMPGVDWSYPYESYPVYSPGESISGSINNSGPGVYSGQKIGVCLVRLDTESFLETLRMLAMRNTPDPKDLISMETIDMSNGGLGKFSFNGLDPGLYAIAAADMDYGEILSALPIFVSDGNISVDSPDTISLGDMGKVRITSLDQLGNATRRFGAILISARDYDTAGLTIRDAPSNGSQDMISTISLGPRSVEIRGEPKISQELVESILSILPQDSAIALQEANTTSSDMYLITDQGWAPGKYILTCGVYTANGITGIEQRFIELVP